MNLALHIVRCFKLLKDVVVLYLFYNVCLELAWTRKFQILSSPEKLNGLNCAARENVRGHFAFISLVKHYLKMIIFSQGVKLTFQTGSQRILLI